MALRCLRPIAAIPPASLARQFRQRVRPRCTLASELPHHGRTTRADVHGQEDTIYAPSTGSGGAIAIVRVSGPNAIRTFELIANKRSCAHGNDVAGAVRSHELTYTSLRCPSSGELLDRCLACYMLAPRTHTGEHACEFNVHASPAVLAGLLHAIAAIDGNRPAEPGEFTRRAFYNGKLDLTGVEALSDLMRAETAAQRRLALSDVAGAASSRTCRRWRQQLIDIAALVEAYIDFSEEDDLGDDLMHQACRLTVALLADLDAACSASAAVQRVRHGYKVTLAGRPNAGKSSLLNAICGRERAIVSPTAGTTRDVLRARVDMRGYAVELADTAGLREADDEQRDPIEVEGQRRARAEVSRSDCVLLVFDTAQLMDSGRLGSLHDVITDNASSAALADGAQCVCVFNKVDMVPRSLVDRLREQAASVSGEHRRVVFTSCLTGDGVDELVELLAAIVRRACSVTSASSSSPTGWAAAAAHTQRQRRLVAAAARHLRRAQRHWHADAVVVAQRVRTAMYELGKITGHVAVDEVLDALFSRFCIGK